MNITKNWVKILLGFSVALAILVGAMIFQPVDPQGRMTDSEPFPIQPVRWYDSIRSSLDKRELFKQFGGNKKFLPGYELQMLLALSAFPELSDVRISFVWWDIAYPLEANLEFRTLFGPRAERHYKILIANQKNSGMEPILFRNLPFDAQVGILAHELGHIEFYHQLNLLDFANWGFNYLVNSDYRATHERSMDEQVVLRGLGNQLYHCAHYYRHDPAAVVLYEGYGKEIFDKNYLTDQEIVELMRRDPGYQP